MTLPYPGSRRACYQATKQTVLNCFRPDQRKRAEAILQAEDIVPEAFYYTLLGRADLVRFDLWLDSEVSKEPAARAAYKEIAEDWCL